MLCVITLFLVTQLTHLVYLLVCGNRLVNGGELALEATCNMGCSGASTYAYISGTVFTY